MNQRAILLGSLIVVAVSPLAATTAAFEPQEKKFTPKLLIAFSSYHPRPKHPQVFFYEHDGTSLGKIIGTTTASGRRVEYRPSLSYDGRYCALASEEENKASRIFFWDVKQKKLTDLPTINDSPNAQLHAALSGNGRYLAFAAWNRPPDGGRWDVILYDVLGKTIVPLPGLNTQRFDERMPALSGDGKWLAFVSNTAGGSDVYLYDLRSGQLVETKNLNSSSMDVRPTLSADGRLMAFVSDRRGGRGGRDIYLYDRQTKKLLPLPGLNSAGHEQSPSLSASGRYIAFVSERIRGAGERDVYLYDRRTQRLLPTPGLNGNYEDFDPCVVELDAAKG